MTKSFVVNETYYVGGSVKGYKAVCVARSKCYVTLEIDGKTYRHKVNYMGDVEVVNLKAYDYTVLATHSVAWLNDWHPKAEAEVVESTEVVEQVSEQETAEVEEEESTVVKFHVGDIYGSGLLNSNIVEITSYSNYGGIIKYGYNLYVLKGGSLKNIYNGVEYVAVCDINGCETMSIETDCGIYTCYATEILPRQTIAPFKPIFKEGESYKINDDSYMTIENIENNIDVGTVITYKVYKKDGYVTKATNHTQKPTYNVQYGSWELDIHIDGVNYQPITPDSVIELEDIAYFPPIIKIQYSGNTKQFEVNKIYGGYIVDLNKKVGVDIRKLDIDVAECTVYYGVDKIRTVGVIKWNIELSSFTLNAITPFGEVIAIAENFTIDSSNRANIWDREQATYYNDLYIKMNDCKRFEVIESYNVGTGNRYYINITDISDNTNRIIYTIHELVGNVDKVLEESYTTIIYHMFVNEWFIDICIDGKQYIVKPTDIRRSYPTTSTDINTSYPTVSTDINIKNERGL